MTVPLHLRRTALAVLLPVLGAACVSPTGPDPRLEPWTPGKALAPAPVRAERAERTEPTDSRRTGKEIVVAGELVPIGTRVVLWSDPGGYDAYARARQRASFAPGRKVGPAGEAVRDPAGIRAAVDQFVLHYDACGVSRECFETLEARGLSVHFLLDVDGTLYQTLDLAETAWHARQANPRSVGVEIANIGAYAPGSTELSTWYSRDAKGMRITLPRRLGDGGVRTSGFVGRPARAGRQRGRINGRSLEQFDFTPQQYETLAHLTAALVQTFPRLRLRFPTDRAGRIRTEALSDAELSTFRGVLGHFHVSADKIDPGPAFDWQGLARRAGALLEAPRP
jgi:N-acetyl-anhydromuramyl-L-alanine amidase AmpD